MTGIAIPQDPGAGGETAIPPAAGPDAAMALEAAGRMAEAGRAWAGLLARAPGDPRLRLGAGAFAFRHGRFEEAAAHFAEAHRLVPRESSPALNLGHALYNLRRFEEALAAYSAAADLAPDSAAPLAAMAAALRGLGRLAEAQEALGRATALAPEDADLHSSHGTALLAGRRYNEAEQAFRRALELRPDDAGLANNLASALRYLGRSDEAVYFYRKAIELQPGYADAHANLALLLRDRGHLQEGIALLRRALEIDPASHGNHSNLIFCLDFLPELGVAEHQAERRAWSARHEAPLAARRRPHGNDRDPERRLRVGYVSADFKVHSASALFGPVVLGHDREAFDPFCYSSTEAEDFRTGEFAAGTSFHRVGHLDDEGLAERIRADGIDILVDLSGHTAGNRLPVFARKPAPVQVTAWGHATSTGLRAMDYFLADPFLVPAAERHLYAETIVDLPCLLCFQAPHYAPAVAPLPADGNGFVTFGCLNRLAKVSDSVLAVWAELLRAVPESRLLLKGAGMDKPANQARFRRAMAAGGVEGERLTFRGETPHVAHLRSYGEVDIALDPFPYCGGTTTCEALWMGVPVVAMAGRVPASRLGVAILSALGFPGLVAGDRRAYLDLARGLAANRDLMRRLRAELRPRFAASAVGDSAQYTRAVEAAYRAMWRRWCIGASNMTAKTLEGD